jgi:hypothetical protein
MRILDNFQGRESLLGSLLGIGGCCTKNSLNQYSRTMVEEDVWQNVSRYGIVPVLWILVLLFPFYLLTPYHPSLKEYGYL